MNKKTVKPNTIEGQFDQYMGPLLDWLRVPQKGEPGYVDVAKDVSSTYLKPTPTSPSPIVEKPMIPVEASKEIDPVVKEYISKKIMGSKGPAAGNPISKTEEIPSEMPLIKKPDYMDKYSDEAYAKAKADSESRQDGLGWLQFAAGMGDALAQRNPSESAKNFDRIRANIKDETIGQFNRDKNQAVDDFKSKQMMNKYDASSNESISFRKMIETQFPKVAQSYGKEWAQVSAADKENIFEPMKLKEMIEARKEEAAYRRAALAAARAEKANKHTELNSSDKKRKDDSEMGLAANRDMQKAYAEGDNTFSLVGDNNFTEARNRFVEAFGRLQSGGAIGEKETEAFKNMGPQPTDSKAIQIKKLKNMEREFLRKLNTLGVPIPSRNSDGSGSGGVNKPKTISQNGHTYTYNELTGEYE